MGVFSVAISIGDTDRHHQVDLSATVDTGAFMMSAPGSLLRAIGIAPTFTDSFRTADGGVRNMDVGPALLRVQGREVITYIAFNEDYTTPLLGSLALETLRMAVDPVDQQLVPLDSLPI